MRSSYRCSLLAHPGVAACRYSDLWVLLFLWHHGVIVAFVRLLAKLSKKDHAFTRHLPANRVEVHGMQMEERSCGRTRCPLAKAQAGELEELTKEYVCHETCIRVRVYASTTKFWAVMLLPFFCLFRRSLFADGFFRLRILFLLSVALFSLLNWPFSRAGAGEK